jgi:hypothetical protein
MFNPARVLEYLFMLFLVRADDPTAMVKNHEPGAGRALIQCSHELGHGSSSN